MPPLALPALLLTLAQAAPPRARPIEAAEVRAWSAGSACSPDDVRIDTLERFDFTGDGFPEAVVVAWTCTSGTGGPTVHAVLTRDADGRLSELRLPELERRTYDALVGNRNSSLAVREGLLVQTFTDSSGREAPLVVRHRWSGSAFVVDSVDRSPTFRTSYDCARATKDLERGICLVEKLAALDRELDRAYRASLEVAVPARREELRAGQRAWLAARDARCGGKFWVECLDAAYRERIAELEPDSGRTP